MLVWLPSAGREANVRQVLASAGGWGQVRFVVATASPALGLGPAEAAWLPLGQSWPRRRLVELNDINLHDRGFRDQ